MLIDIGLKYNQNLRLLIGNKSPVGSAYFVKLQNGQQIYHVNSSVVENFFMTGNYVYKYMNKFIISTSKDAMNRIVYYKNGSEYSIDKEKSGKWNINGKGIKDEYIGNLLDDIVLLQISGIDAFYFLPKRRDSLAHIFIYDIKTCWRNFNPSFLDLIY